MASRWLDPREVSKVTYVCAYCGNKVGPSEMFQRWERSDRVYICPSCEAPTVLWGKKLHPAPRFGGTVRGLPDDVSALYDEARACMAAPSYTGAVLLCRKILMHVAIETGAEGNLKFVEYVDFLVEKWTPSARTWVDHIRTKANEATHEIVLMERTDAERIITFTEMLLQLVYEFPARAEGALPAESGDGIFSAALADPGSIGDDDIPF